MRKSKDWEPFPGMTSLNNRIKIYLKPSPRKLDCPAFPKDTSLNSLTSHHTQGEQASKSSICLLEHHSYPGTNDRRECQVGLRSREVMRKRFVLREERGGETLTYMRKWGEVNLIYGLTTHAFQLKEGNHFHLYTYLQWKEKGVAKVHSRCHSSVGYRGSVKASGSWFQLESAYGIRTGLPHDRDLIIIRWWETTPYDERGALRPIKTPVCPLMRVLRKKLGTELRFSSDYHSGRPDSSRRFTGRLAEELSARETEQVGISSSNCRVCLEKRCESAYVK